MDLVIAFVGVGGAVLVAVVGFWLALRQDERRWIREKRADLYIDVLAEGYAEQEYVLDSLTRVEIAEIADPDATDVEARRRAVADWERIADKIVHTQLPPDQRALLGARMTAFATPAVSSAFNAIGACLPMTLATGQASGLKIKVRLAFDQLETVVQAELLAAQASLWQRILHR